MSDDDKYVFKRYWISQIKSGKHNGEYLDIGGSRVYRTNIMATVVSKFISEDNNYSAVVLDDGSATIRAKTWRDDTIKFRGLQNGDLLNIFGSVQYYNDEIYISPLIVSQVRNPNWEIVRKLELFKARGKPDITENESKSLESEEVKKESAKKADGSNTKKVTEWIKKLDAGRGADIAIVIEKTSLTREEVIQAVRTLMDRGDVYEPEPNKLKVLE